VRSLRKEGERIIVSHVCDGQKTFSLGNLLLCFTHHRESSFHVFPPCPSGSPTHHILIEQVASAIHEVPTFLKMFEFLNIWSQPRWPLHVTHISLMVLTTLFLLLDGVSGPVSGYWWIQVTYSGSSYNSSSSEGDTSGTRNGTVWDLGALGACQSGQR
jgi:hypothetical protein